MGKVLGINREMKCLLRFLGPRVRKDPFLFFQTNLMTSSQSQKQRRNVCLETV
jgi:hypothetical protein